MTIEKNRSIRRFLLFSLAILVLDWIAIVFYIQRGRYFPLFALEILHLRVIFLVYIYIQLREISLHRVEASILAAPEPVAVLTVDSKIASIYGAETVREGMPRK
jgi:hypothetical protein